MKGISKSFRRVCLVGAVVGALVGVSVPAAYAQSLWSAYFTFSVSGYTYGDKAAVTVFADGSGATARTTLDGVTRSPNCLATDAILWNGSWHVMSETGYSYNSYTTYTWTCVTFPKVTNHGLYQSQGSTKVKRDDGTWYTHYTSGTDALRNPLP
jgi:hypothetical protein